MNKEILASVSCLLCDPEILKQWDTRIIYDIPNHPLGKLGPAAKVGMKSCLSAPIRFGGRLRAALKRPSSAVRFRPWPPNAQRAGQRGVKTLRSLPFALCAFTAAKSFLCVLPENEMGCNRL